MAKYNPNILLIAIAGMAVMASGCTGSQADVAQVRTTTEVQAATAVQTDTEMQTSTAVQTATAMQTATETATAIQTTTATQTPSVIQTSIQSQASDIIQTSTPAEVPMDTPEETSIHAPTAYIIAENNPDTVEYDLRISHKGGDTLRGGEWKLSIVPLGNQTSFITSASGFDLSAGAQIEVTAITEGTSSLTYNSLTGDIALKPGDRYDVKLVHIPTNAMIVDQFIEVR